MSAGFVFPDWARDRELPQPQPDFGEVDPHRIEALVNRFIAAKQDALFTAPDAFYRRTGADAVDGAPAIIDRLAGLRQSTLDRAHDDNERALLGPRLDLHIADATDGIDRHVGKQQDALARQIIGERQTLIQRAAELEYNNDDKLAALAEAQASAAAELARMNDEPEEPAIESARSAIWRTAVGQRLAAGDSAQAVALFERIKDQLAARDRRAVDLPIRLAATDIAADRWIERQAVAPGEPLAERAAVDTGLSPAEKASVLSKIAERSSATESARVATVKGLDDQLDAAHRALATAPARYEPATFVALANAYDDAGEPDQAAATRRLAEQENVLRRFAKSSVGEQQRLIDSLPQDAREAARAVQRRQAEAFAKDAFTAGAALYPDVGKPVPIDDIDGRIHQARQIAHLRGVPVAPFTADEIADMRRTLAEGPGPQQQAVRARLAGLPEDLESTVPQSS
jgi:hypothetical protein